MVDLDKIERFANIVIGYQRRHKAIDGKARAVIGNDNVARVGSCRPLYYQGLRP